MRPPFQERFQVYVMGPNQDARLDTSPAGQTVEDVHVRIDLDAPFVLRARAVGILPTIAGDQNGLQFLKTRWRDSIGQYRQGDYILESLIQPYFGQNGCPKCISPEITYPPNGVITLDLINTGAAPIVGLSFYWIGVNLYPWGALPAPTYPSEFRATTFAQPFESDTLVSPTIRIRQPFTAKNDGDLVIRAAQAGKFTPEGQPG